jgi:hypothetical protein
MGCVIFTACITVTIAQTKSTNESIATSSGFVQFKSDGISYGMNTEKDNSKVNAELKYSATIPRVLLAVYSRPDSRDTILILLSDDKGLSTATPGNFSGSAKLFFIYKLYGKGSMIKSVDNAKGEITAANYIKLTTLEAKPGGVAEGSFSFTDIPFQNKEGKVVARIRGISDGHFKAIITKYSEITPGTVSTAARNGLSPVANILFKDIKCKLTDTDKNEIAKMTGFVLSGKKEQPFAMDKESLEYPYNAVVTVTDMNKDGIEEVFIQFGNTYTSGNTGANIVLYIKDKQKGYKTNLGFPGVEPEQLKTGFGGYPDLLIGGPGFEFPIWRWNGKEYVYYKSKKM